MPPSDTGETVGLNPHRLTLTFGCVCQFLEKDELGKQASSIVQGFTAIPKEQLRENILVGDIVIQACADDEQVAFHAIRNLMRKGRNAVTLRWSQSGFAAIGDRMETPRNLFGFKDGTANPSKEKDFDRVIWADSKDWMENGSYMAVRRIQMFLETWDRTSLEEQENTSVVTRKVVPPLVRK